MVRTTICSVIVLAALSCTNQPDYLLTWSDEFDAPTLNEAYWNVEDNGRGGGNAELQYYSPNNVSIEKHPVTGESCLVLTARREDYYFDYNSNKCILWNRDIEEIRNCYEDG